MSHRTASLALWVSLLATLPVPYFMVEIGWMPTIWLLCLAFLVSASALLDGFMGTWLIALLFILQALGYAGLLYLASRLFSRGLRRLRTHRPRLADLAVATVLLVLWWSSSQPIYFSDLVNVDPRMRLFEIF